MNKADELLVEIAAAINYFCEKESYASLENIHKTHAKILEYIDENNLVNDLFEIN